MPTLFKEVNYNLAALVQQIDLGAIGLPDIQRPFVWPDTKVRDLFDSMYKGYPVGYLLFWANANIEGVNVKGIGTSEKQKHPSLLIVDGQQRLTSLYAVIKGQAYVFFLIGRVDLGMDMFRLKKLTARWFFMSSLTGRYTSSPESQMESDLARIRTIRSGDEFEQILEEIIAGQFTSDYWALNLPRALATSASTSPSLYAYYASLHILDAFGLFPGSKSPIFSRKDCGPTNLPWNGTICSPKPTCKRLASWISAIPTRLPILHWWNGATTSKSAIGRRRNTYRGTCRA